MLAMWFGYSMY